MRWGLLGLLALLSLGACGFQLRGASLGELNLNYRLAYSGESSPAYTDFQRILSGTLSRQGMRPGTPADITLQISDLVLDTVDGAVDTQLRVAEKVTIASMTLRVLDGQGKVLAAQQQLTKRDVYRIDRSQLLGSHALQSDRQESVLAELSQQVVRVLLIVTRQQNSAVNSASSKESRPLAA